MSEAHKSVPIAASAAGRGVLARLLSRLLQEPLFHFLLIGAAVFGIYGLVAPPAAPGGSEIIITAADAKRLKGQFRAAWSRDPSPEEFNGLLDNFIREEIFYREAKLFGLDQNDQVIRVRLRQKAEYLLAGPADFPAPTETQLRAHYQASIFNYMTPATISFQQVFLGNPSDEDVAHVQDALKGGADATTLGRAGLLPGTMPPSRQSVVDGTFGIGFFAILSAAPVGEWKGPVASAYGQHMIRVESVTQSQAPPFEQVREQVEADWRRIEGEKAKEAAYQALKARYRVDISQIDAAT